jgi:small subunit ribosomal protein S4
MKLTYPSRITRRIGERLFLKPERDQTAKSAMVRRPYPPGMHGKRSRRSGSEFAAELREKQKIRMLYGISDTVLKRYVKAADRPGSKTRPQLLYEKLEHRLDNAIYRLGLAPSRRTARQLASHGHMALNGKPARNPSQAVKPGDRITIREASRPLPIFEGLDARLKKHQPPSWLVLDAEAAAGTVERQAALEEDITIAQSLAKIIEFYSR